MLIWGVQVEVEFEGDDADKLGADSLPAVQKEEEGGNDTSDISSDSETEDLADSAQQVTEDTSKHTPCRQQPEAEQSLPGKQSHAKTNQVNIIEAGNDKFSREASANSSQGTLPPRKRAHVVQAASSVESPVATNASSKSDSRSGKKLKTSSGTFTVETDKPGMYSE